MENGDKMSLVKKLREETMIGMFDCKSALEEASYDYDQAKKLLRERGKVSAAKKVDRATGCGLVGIKKGQHEFAVVELGCETDFVAIGDDFNNLLSAILTVALAARTQDIAALATYNNGEVTTLITETIAKIGENIQIKNVTFVDCGDYNIAYYVHNAQKNPDFGQVISVVVYDGEDDKFKDDIRTIAMHIVAMSPIAVSTEEIDPALIEEEKRICTEQAKASGKSEGVIAKMVEGRMNKFFSEVVLLEQQFVKDDQIKVGQFVKRQAGKLGVTLKLLAFGLFKSGAQVRGNIVDIVKIIEKNKQ